MKQLGSHWTDFHDICYLNILLKHAKKIQVALKSHNKQAIYMKNNTYFLSNLAHFFRMRNIIEKNFVDKIRTQISGSILFFKIVPL